MCPSTTDNIFVMVNYCIGKYIPCSVRQCPVHRIWAIVSIMNSSVLVFSFVVVFVKVFYYITLEWYGSFYVLYCALTWDIAIFQLYDGTVVPYLLGVLLHLGSNWIHDSLFALRCVYLGDSFNCYHTLIVLIFFLSFSLL